MLWSNHSTKLLKVISDIHVSPSLVFNLSKTKHMCGENKTCVLKPISKKHFYGPLTKLSIQLSFILTLKKNHYMLLQTTLVRLYHMILFNSVFSTDHSRIFLRYLMTGTTESCFTWAETHGEEFVVVKFMDGYHRKTKVSSVQSMNKISNNNNCSTVI